MARYSLPLTEAHRLMLKDIKYYTGENWSDVIIGILEKYLPVKLEQAKKEYEEKKKG